MDLFKFTGPANGDLSGGPWREGEMIENVKRITWVERYREAGEFTLVSDVSANLKDFLPLGTFISHVDTPEVMIVENHEVTTKGGRQELITTGRSLEVFLEHRVMGSNQPWPINATIPTQGYPIAANETWWQAIYLMNTMLNPIWLVNDEDALPYVSVTPEGLESFSGTVEDRVLPWGESYETLIQILEIDNLGIKTIRPSQWTPTTIADEDHLAFVVHYGENKTSSVVFSHAAGDIVSADYLWSNKKLKNCCVVISRWCQIAVIDDTVEGWDRRWMFVDGSFIDNLYTENPDPTTRAEIRTAMTALANMVLSHQKEVTIISAEVNKQEQSRRYRIDYDLGDFVTIIGEYETNQIVQVIEHVEIEDETGESSYPTFKYF